jgi:CRISPR/Cas system CSM-associated protein Csm3 (group 7 of RAMP superfamily)
LFIGGYSHATGESDGDTAAGPQGQPFIPGSTVKGALRESAVRLTEAVREGDQLLIRLFGAEENNQGLIRIGPLRAQLPDSEGDASLDDALSELTIRNHVSLDRARKQAAPGRLFQNRVSPAVEDLRFCGELRTSRDLSDEELGLLQCAAEITDQIGGGRGRGLGLVSVTIDRADNVEEASPQHLTVPTGSTEVVLVLEAMEPLQLGRVKDETNLRVSSGYLEGSAIRGAVAAALAESGEDLDAVLGGRRPVVFGDGRAGHVTAIPAPMTLRVPKAGGAPVDSAATLCADFLLERCTEPWQSMRVAKETVAQAVNYNGWDEVKLKRRIVTRTARNHISGRSADGMLYSLEVIDPVMGSSTVATDNDKPPLRFYAPIAGSQEQLAAVVRAASPGLTIGSARSRGLGSLSLVELIDDTGIPPLPERHARWCTCLAELGVKDRELAASTGVVLALGPIAVDQERLLRAFKGAGLEIAQGVSRRRPGGGWNAQVGLPRFVTSQLAPGSTFIVRSLDGGSALAGLDQLEKSGIGPGRADGWGRIVACHPIHNDCLPKLSDSVG